MMVLSLFCGNSALSADTDSQVYFSSKQVVVVERGKEQPFSVDLIRTGRLDKALRVRVVAIEGTAKVGQDFSPVDTWVTFPPGDTSAKKISFTVNTDFGLEWPETFRLIIESQAGEVTQREMTVIIPMTSNDAVVLGLLFLLLGFVFIRGRSKFCVS